MTNRTTFTVCLFVFVALLESSTAARTHNDEHEHSEVHHVETKLQSNSTTKMASLSRKVADDARYAVGVADKVLSKVKSGLLETVGFRFGMHNGTAHVEQNATNDTSVHHIGQHEGPEQNRLAEHERLISMVIFNIMAFFLIHKLHKPGNRFRLLSCVVCCCCGPAGWLTICMPIDEDTKVGEPVHVEAEQPQAASSAPPQAAQ